MECLRWVHKRCSGISGKIKSNVDFHCRRCLEGENVLFQSVLLKDVVIEPKVKLEYLRKFCYLGGTLGAGGGVEEAARARVRCAWAKFKKLFPILIARSASYRILMSQRLERRAEDREIPVSISPKTNFSIMVTLPFKSTGE